MNVVIPQLVPLMKFIGQLIDFSKEEADFFTQHISIKQYGKGSFLLHENKIAQCIFFINEGITRNLVTTPDGVEHTQYFSQENTFITEYASFLHGTPAIYGIQCIEPCEVAIIPKQSIELGYLHIKEGNKLGRLIAEAYFVQFVRNAHERQTKTVIQQYEDLEKRFPRIHQRVPQHMVASFLGVTPVHLSRLKAQYKRP